MRNPEQELLKSESLVETLYKRALEARKENPPIDPNQEEFRSLYGNAEVEKDIDYVEEMEGRFKREGGERAPQHARILEEIFAEQIELSDWLGPEVDTITPSRYDDIKNGVDVIIEVRNTDEKSAEHLALAVDVTYASELSEKFNRIAKEIRKGSLTQVKYFHSEFLGEYGGLTHIPRVVIGAGRGVVEEVGEAWLRHDTKTLAAHEIQSLVLEEIRVQLEAFAEYARLKKQDTAADTYEQALALITKIQEGKKHVPLEKLQEDRVFKAIIRETENLLREARAVAA